jgi:hypothetical protein
MDASHSLPELTWLHSEFRVASVLGLIHGVRGTSEAALERAPPLTTRAHDRRHPPVERANDDRDCDDLFEPCETSLVDARATHTLADCTPARPFFAARTAPRSLDELHS